MGKLFETGWERKPRGPDGKLINPPSKPTSESDKGKDAVKPKDGMETVKVTRTVGTKEKGVETSELAQMHTQTDGLVPESAAGQVILEGTRVPEI